MGKLKSNIQNSLNNDYNEDKTHFINLVQYDSNKLYHDNTSNKYNESLQDNISNENCTLKSYIGDFNSMAPNHLFDNIFNDEDNISPFNNEIINQQPLEFPIIKNIITDMNTSTSLPILNNSSTTSSTSSPLFINNIIQNNSKSNMNSILANDFHYNFNVIENWPPTPDPSPEYSKVPHNFNSTPDLNHTNNNFLLPCNFNDTINLSINSIDNVNNDKDINYGENDLLWSFWPNMLTPTNKVSTMNRNYNNIKNINYLPSLNKSIDSKDHMLSPVNSVLELFINKDKDKDNNSFNFDSDFGILNKESYDNLNIITPISNQSISNSNLFSNYLNKNKNTDYDKDKLSYNNIIELESNKNITGKRNDSNYFKLIDNLLINNTSDTNNILNTNNSKDKETNNVIRKKRGRPRLKASKEYEGFNTTNFNYNNISHSTTVNRDSAELVTIFGNKPENVIPPPDLYGVIGSCVFYKGKQIGIYSTRTIKMNPNSTNTNDNIKEQKLSHFACIICNRGFPRIHALRSHMRCHDDRQFSCSECTMSFRRNHDLRRHQRSMHDAEKPLECLICHKRFPRADALRRHQSNRLSDSACRSS